MSVASNWLPAQIFCDIRVPEESIPAKPTIEGIIIPKIDATLTEASVDVPFVLTCGSAPQQNVCYTDVTGKFTTGTWASDAFESEQRPFPYNEFAYVQQGSMTLTYADGSAEVFNVGDAFFIPEGTACNAAVAAKARLSFAVIKST